MNKKKKNVMFFAAMLIVVGMGVLAGAAYSFFITNDTARNSLTMGNPDIDLIEPNWDPEKAKIITPGVTMIKDPILLGKEGTNYARLVVEFYDTDTNNKITQVNRVEKIKELIYYDKSYDRNNDPVTSTINPDSSYSKNELKAFENNNQIVKLYNTTDFVLDDSRSTDVKLVFNYKNVLNKGDQKVLFTNLIIPVDYSQKDLDLIGNFKINIYAEAIQSDNTGSMNEAFKALDGENNE